MNLEVCSYLVEGGDSEWNATTNDSGAANKRQSQVDSGLLRDE